MPDSHHKCKVVLEVQRRVPVALPCSKFPTSGRARGCYGSTRLHKPRDRDTGPDPRLLDAWHWRNVHPTAWRPGTDAPLRSRSLVLFSAFPLSRSALAPTQPPFPIVAYRPDDSCFVMLTECNSSSTTHPLTRTASSTYYIYDTRLGLFS